MKVSIKIDNRLVEDKTIDTDAFAKACLQEIHLGTGMVLDKSSLSMKKDNFNSTAIMKFIDKPVTLINKKLIDNEPTI